MPAPARSADLLDPGRPPRNAANSGTTAALSPRVRPQRLEDALADPGRLVLRLGQEEPAHGAKRLMDAVELDVPLELVELAGGEPPDTRRDDRAQSLTSAVLPIPGAPVTSTPRQRPASARSNAPSRAATSVARPTSRDGGSTRGGRPGRRSGSRRPGCPSRGRPARGRTGAPRACPPAWTSSGEAGCLASGSGLAGRHALPPLTVGRRS